VLFRSNEKLLRDLFGNDSSAVGEDVEIISPQNLKVGSGVYVGSKTLLHCGGMGWCNNKGGISLGNNVYIGPQCILFGAGEIEIGDNVLISPNVTITSHQHTFASREKPIRGQATQFAKVTIEEDVWIGSNAVILPGVVIGRGSVIGAGAVVTRDIPPFSVAVGVPARVIKDRFGGKNG